MLQENVVCKQLTLLYGQETTFPLDQCVVDYKSLNGLGKQSGFSIVPAAQYCSVAHERVKAQTSHSIYWNENVFPHPSTFKVELQITSSKAVEGRERFIVLLHI